LKGKSKTKTKKILVPTREVGPKQTKQTNKTKQNKTKQNKTKTKQNNDIYMTFT